MTAAGPADAPHAEPPFKTAMLHQTCATTWLCATTRARSSLRACTGLLLSCRLSRRSTSCARAAARPAGEHRRSRRVRAAGHRGGSWERHGGPLGLQAVARGAAAAARGDARRDRGAVGHVRVRAHDAARVLQRRQDLRQPRAPGLSATSLPGGGRSAGRGGPKPALAPAGGRPGGYAPGGSWTQSRR